MSSGPGNTRGGLLNKNRKDPFRGHFCFLGMVVKPELLGNYKLVFRRFTFRNIEPDPGIPEQNRACRTQENRFGYDPIGIVFM
jgi:uncharacterized membrane protein YecN with MAPEG domain